LNLGWDDLVRGDLATASGAVHVSKRVLVVAEVTIGVAPAEAPNFGDISVDGDVVHAEDELVVTQESGKLEILADSRSDAIGELVDLALELEGLSVGALTCM